MGRFVEKRNLVRFAALLLLSAAAVFSSAKPAFAHSDVVETEPAAGAVVSQLQRVVLRFAEPVETTGIHVWLQDEDGSYTLGPAVHPGGDGRVVELPVPAVASARYTVGYHIVSDDGDVVTGSFGFTLDLPPVAGAASEPLPPPLRGTETSPAVHEDHASELPAGAGRVVLDASLASLVGGLAFVVTVWPQGASNARTRRLLWSAAVAAAVASLVVVIVQHAAAEGLGLLEALSPQHLIQSLQFRFGRIAAARLVLLALAAALTARLGRGGDATARSGRWCTAVVAVAIGLFETIVLLGHSGRSGTLGEAARLVHTIGISVWLGGLVMLFVVVLPRRKGDELVAVLPRFSKLATFAVGSVVIGGVALSIDLVGTAGSLPTTPYGRLLLLKLLAVGALLVAASRSRDTVRRRLAVATSSRQHRALAGPITTWIAVELGLMSLVLALTALLVANAPPA